MKSDSCVHASDVQCDGCSVDMPARKWPAKRTEQVPAHTFTTNSVRNYWCTECDKLYGAPCVEHHL